MGGKRGLPIVEQAWDGGSAAARVLDWAGGETLTPAKARQGFLVYDDADPKSRTAYKLPFADVVDGALVAVSGGVTAAAQRLPGADIPDDVKATARVLLDSYMERMGEEHEEQARLPLDEPETREQPEPRWVVGQRRDIEMAPIERAPRLDEDVAAGVFRGQPISVEEVDRDGDIIRVAGGRFDSYLQNPVVLFAHDRWRLPVAATTRLYQERLRGLPAWMADYRYPPRGVSSLADEVHGMDAADMIGAASIGFYPRGVVPMDEHGSPVMIGEPGAWQRVTGFDVRSWEHLEWSRVPVPSNRAAVRKRLEAVGIQKGNGSSVLAWLSTVECVTGASRSVVSLASPRPRRAPVAAALSEIMRRAPRLVEQTSRALRLGEVSNARR